MSPPRSVPATCWNGYAALAWRIRSNIVWTPSPTPCAESPRLMSPTATSSMAPWRRASDTGRNTWGRTDLAHQDGLVARPAAFLVRAQFLHLLAVLRRIRLHLAHGVDDHRRRVLDDDAALGKFLAKHRRVRDDDRRPL